MLVKSELPVPKAFFREGLEHAARNVAVGCGPSVVGFDRIKSLTEPAHVVGRPGRDELVEDTHQHDDLRGYPGRWESVGK